MEPPERIVISGSRSWTNEAVIRDFIDSLEPGSEVIVGGARGADQIGERFARDRGDLIVIRDDADWEVKPTTPITAIRHRLDGSSYDIRAGALRNRRMLARQPTRLVAFHDGSSGGTQDCIDEARKRGIPVEVVQDAPQEALW